MNEPLTISQRIARRITAHACRGLESERSDWARAMRNELDYIPPGLAAILWSLGCLFASYTEGTHMIKIGNIRDARISRVALTLEMLFCFLLPCGGLLTAIMFGFFVQNPMIFSSDMTMLLLSTSLTGPLGLYLAFRAIVLERTRISRGLMATFGALAVWSLIGNTIFVLTVANPLSVTRALILVAVVPAIGAAHLIVMSLSSPREPAPA